MTIVTIKATVMGFRLSVTPSGVIHGTGISIMEFAKNFMHYQYDNQLRRQVLVNKYYHFDRTNETCYFPRYALDEFKRFLTLRGCESIVEEIPPSQGSIVEYHMLPFVEYKNDIQKNAIDYLTNPSSGPTRGLSLQTGGGKLQSLDCLIKTSTGWTRMGDIKLGEQLLMPDGTTAPVCGIYPQGKVDMYRVTFEDGRWTEAGGEHLWRVNYVQWGDKWRIITTDQIAQYLTQPTYKIRMGVQLVEHEIMDDVELPLDPYTLGVILGDGSISSKKSINISKPDDWLRLEVGKNLPDGMSVGEFAADGKAFRILGRTGLLRKSLGDILEDLSLIGTYSHTKFIPQMYLDASPRQRLHLLQGLMDTDGTVNVTAPRGSSEKVPGKGGSVKFCTTSREMALQVQYLIRSLGGLCKISHKIPFYTYRGERKQGRYAYILAIRYKKPKDLFRLPRKRDLVSDNYQYADRLKLRIKSVEYIGKKEAQCIAVDHPDHLYITDDYIVTHNTVSAIWAFQKLGRRAVVTMTSRLEQWFSEIQKYTTLEEDDIYIVAGEPSLTKLFTQIDKQICPKIILMSTKTLRLYLEYGDSYKHLPHPSIMCDSLGVGIVATDEAHEHFMSNFLFSIIFNPSVFIPITATFVASDPFVREIFDNLIPKKNQFTGGEYKRYTNITSYIYKSGGQFISPYHYKGRQGYSQQIFEKFLMSKKGKFVLEPLIHTAILPIIREHYGYIAEKGEKFLFLCSSLALCDHLEKVLKREYPDKTIAVFSSGKSTTILENSDMILSTPGSAGCLTGDTVVSISRNHTYGNAGSYTCTLKNAYLHFNNLAERKSYNWNREVPTYIRSYNGERIQLGQVGDILYSGVKDVYKVTLSNGFSIKCTADHPIMTTDGWVEAKDIVGKRVMCDVNKRATKKNGRRSLSDAHINVSPNHPYARKSTKSSKGRHYFTWRLEMHRAIYEAVVLNKMTLDEYRQSLKDPLLVKTMKFVDPSIYDIHHIDYNHYNNDPDNLTVMERSAHKELHALRTKMNFNQGIPEYFEAVSIEYLGEEDTYDIHCLDQNHNFVANGIVVHNTGRDIKNLRTCFAFEVTQSEARNLQFLGRLRDFPAVKNTPEFVTLAFGCIPQHVRYTTARALLYGPRGKSFKHRTIG